MRIFHGARNEVRIQKIKIIKTWKLQNTKRAYLNLIERRLEMWRSFKKLKSLSLEVQIIKEAEIVRDVGLYQKL